MIPELFHIGKLSISPFGVMMALSFVAAYFQLRWGLRKLDVGDDDDASALVLAGAVAGIIGAKIYYVLLYRDWHLLFDRSGFVWYGGFMLATAATVWTMRRRSLPVWATLDAATLALAVGYAVGRVGCFLVGDDYGRPSDLPWAVAFPMGLPPTDTPVHPTQLYEMVLLVPIAWALVHWRRQGVADRVVFGRYLVLAGALRFAIEFVRVNEPVAGPFTLAHLISAAITLVGAYLIATARR